MVHSVYIVVIDGKSAVTTNTASHSQQQGLLWGSGSLAAYAFHSATGKDSFVV